MDLDDLFSEPAAASARAGGKFKPKARPHVKKQTSVSTASGLPGDAKEKLSMQSSSMKGEERVALDTEVACDGSANLTDALPSDAFAPSSGTINQSTYATFSEEAWTDVDLDKNIGDDIEAAAFPNDSGTQDTVIFRDFAASEMDEGIHIQNERTQTEETEDYFDMETLDIVQEGTTAYGQHTRKFEPKPKVQNDVQTEGGNQCANETDSCYPADAIDCFSMGSNISEFLVNGEPRIETSNTDSNFYGNVQEALDIPEMPVSEMERGNASGGWGHKEQVECPSNNTIVGEDACWEVTINGLPEGVSDFGRSREVFLEENVCAQKRKHTIEALNQSCEDPPKKFRHSTRQRRRRTLDKELLETPDEEIRFLPIRDMLRLADFKEWSEKKEAKEAGVRQMQESTRKASDSSGSQNDGKAFDLVSTENQENIRVQSANFLLNYHTYMKRERRVQWSKHDTALFYEGVCQFGSDLSMIQQLFPDKTREHIKLKYKFEERRNPLKLNDALANRTKHHYHFQNVIKKLQEAAAQAAREANEVEEEEAATETACAVPNKEAETTDFPSEEEAAKSGATERAGVESDVRSDVGDEEGGEDFWSSYESNI